MISEKYDAGKLVYLFSAMSASTGKTRKKRYTHTPVPQTK